MELQNMSDSSNPDFENNIRKGTVDAKTKPGNKAFNKYETDVRIPQHNDTTGRLFSRRTGVPYVGKDFGPKIVCQYDNCGSKAYFKCDCRLRFFSLTSFGCTVSNGCGKYLCKQHS